MDPRIGTALIVLVGVPAVLIGYIYGTELLLRTLPERLKPKVRPWLWLLPALAFLFVFLIYPTIGTIIRSFRDKLDESFVGFANYQQFASSDVTLTALRNNILWVIFLTLFCVGVGMLIAILVDRVR